MFRFRFPARGVAKYRRITPFKPFLEIQEDRLATNLMWFPLAIAPLADDLAAISVTQDNPPPNSSAPKPVEVTVSAPWSEADPLPVSRQQLDSGATSEVQPLFGADATADFTDEDLQLIVPAQSGAMESAENEDETTVYPAAFKATLSGFSNILDAATIGTQYAPSDNSGSYQFEWHYSDGINAFLDLQLTETAFNWTLQGDDADGESGTSSGSVSHGCSRPFQFSLDGSDYLEVDAVFDDSTHIDIEEIGHIDNNTPPVAQIEGPTSGNEGSALAFVGSHTDPDLCDSHTYSWTATSSTNQVIAGGSGANFGFTPNDNDIHDYSNRHGCQQRRWHGEAGRGRGERGADADQRNDARLYDQ